MVRDANRGGSPPGESREVEPLVSGDGDVAVATWSAVVGGRARAVTSLETGSSRLSRIPSASTVAGSNRRADAFVRGVKRVFRSSVILIRSIETGVSDADILRRIRGKVSPKDFGIKNIRFQEASNGGVLLEILGSDVFSDKVDDLAGAIGSVLSGCASVSRARKAEFRLRGFDLYISVEELRKAKAGGCSVSAVTVSGIRRLNSGHRVSWVCCPVNAARFLEEGRFLEVGWSLASMDMVQVKRLQCFRCWRFGHVRGSCKATIDRVGHCFRCGEAGHMVGA